MLVECRVELEILEEKLKSKYEIFTCFNHLQLFLKNKILKKIAAFEEFLFCKKMEYVNFVSSNKES